MEPRCLEHVERTVVSNQDVGYVCDMIRNAAPHHRVVYDVETGCSPEVDELFDKKGALQPYGGAYLTGMSVCIDRGEHRLVGYYIPLGHESGNVSPLARANITEALGHTQAMHVGFNTPFDWAFLMNEGLLFDTPMYAQDVQILRWLQDENGIKALKKLGAMWLGEDADAEQKALKAMMKAECSTITEARDRIREQHPELRRVNAKGTVLKGLNEEGEALAAELRRARTWTDLTPEELGTYAARDATLTANLHRMLVSTSPVATVEREMAVNAICIDMTRKGLSVDHSQLREASEGYLQRETEMRKRLREEHALENPSSGPQVAALLYDRLGLPIRGTTPSGEPSTNKNALEQLQGHPVVADILECRHLQKARTAYADAFLKHAEASPDGKVHGFFATTRTATGRLAASNPNVMTIPRDDTLPEVRKAFNISPAPGYTRFGFDLASAELWVTAHFTSDPELIETLLEGENLHVKTMLQVFGGEPDKKRREYTLSKNVNYGIVYGAGLEQITIFAAKAGYDPAEARRVAEVARSGHKRVYAELHRMADWWAAQARKLGTLPLHPEGRFRHFTSPGNNQEYYTALNALVQGGVAEFMKDTMIEVYKRGYGELLVLQVHDELVFDAPSDMEQELLDMLQKISHDINPFKYELRWDAKAWA